MCPQLAVYDELLPALAPYLTFASPRNHRSAVVNTDETGFRLSYQGPERIDTTTWPAGRPGGLVLGSSFVFGVGATSDSETLVSHLNAILPYAFLNLGVRAGNSTQELVAAIPFLERAECVVVCSGISNLVVNFQSLEMNELFGPFFGEGTYELLRDRPLSEVASLVGDTSNGLGLKRQVRGGLGRLWSRATRRWRAGDGPVSRLDASGWDARVASALQLQRRDLRVLARARRKGSRMLFAAQPFAPCCSKAPSPEERSMFEVSDRSEGSDWNVLKQALTERWPQYLSELRHTCIEEEISFVDLNTCDLTGWSFVDRVHMTDAGYRQEAHFLAEQIGPV